MSEINLSRIFSSKKDAAPLLQMAMKTMGTDSRLMDRDGNILLTSGKGQSATRYPIHHEDDVVGWVEGDDKGEVVASLASYVIGRESERRALADEVLDVYREINLLYNLSEKLSSSLEIETVANLVLTEAVRLIEATEAALITPAPDEPELFRPVGTLGKTFSSDTSYVVGVGIIGSVLESGKAEIVNSVMTDPRYEDTDGKNTMSMMITPLDVQSRRGVLVVSSPTPRTYTARELKLLSAVASQATSSIENARLHEDKMNEAREREEQRLAEQEIRHLTEINRLKDEYLRMASHDLKNPIGIVMTYTQLIEAREFITDPKGKHYLERISMGAQKMLSLVNDLLDLARIEDGMALNRQPVDLNEFMQSFDEDFHTLAQQQDIFWRNKPLGEPVKASLDKDRMSQVLTNLFSNAIKFTESGGEVNVSITKKDKTVTISVADTGHGIPADDLPRLFEKFYRVQNEDNTEFEGTGLGLAIAKAIIEQHEGKIWVESVVNEGSTFFIELPLL